MDGRAAAAVGALLVLGMFLLELKVPMLLAIAVAAAGFLAQLLFQMRLDRVGVVVLINYLFWTWSALLTGAISPLDFINPAFLSGDGRIFVAYLPLLFFSVVQVREQNIWTLHRLFMAVAAMSIGLFMFWVPTKAAALSEGASGHFVGFLTSHTGGGTFFGVMVVLLILYGIESGRRYTTLLGLASLLPLLGSGSREALLAFLAVVGWYIVKRRQWKIAVYSLSVLGLLILVTPILAPQTWARTAGLFTWDLVENVAATVRTADWKPGDGEEELDLSGTEVNVLFRITIWTYALGRFIESPILGIGFGRYNDYDLKFWGLPGLFYVATDGYKIIGASNAHNSYVHALCEGGVIGLGLLLWLWATLYQRLRCQERDFWVLRDVRAIAVAGQGLVVFSLVAALTGHALAAPSLGIPATTIIGTVLAYHRMLMRARAAG